MTIGNPGPTLDHLIEQAAAELGTVLPTSAPLDGLERTVASYRCCTDRTPLSDLAFHGNVVRSIKNLTTTEVLAQATPPLAAAQVPTSAIVGLPRTGSTLLHNLLALETGTTFVSHLDAIHAWWRLPGGSLDEARQDAADRLGLIDAISPAIRDAHPLAPGWPDECTMVLENSGASHQWPITYGLPELLDWLDDADLGRHYDAYWRAVLVLSAPDAVRRILKSPFHLLQLPQLLRVAPNIRLIHTVRPTAQVVPSWFKLLAAARSAFFDGRPLPSAAVGRWRCVLGRMAEVASDLEVTHSDRCQTVRYDDLVRDPIGVVEAILDRDGRAVTTSHRDRMTVWLSDGEARRRLALGADVSAVGGDDADASFARYDLVFGSGIGSPVR